MVRPRACGIADLESGDGADADEPSFDSLRPITGVARHVQSTDRRFVDEPSRHDQASVITSGLSRSCVRAAICANWSIPTGPLAWVRSRSKARRRYSVRDRPTRFALASIAASTSSGTSRMSMSVTVGLHDIRWYHGGSRLSRPAVGLRKTSPGFRYRRISNSATCGRVRTLSQKDRCARVTRGSPLVTGCFRALTDPEGTS
ncbi:MAG: hypothetical protein ACI9C1_000949 [Candidatus Aldehydirespiratoraceae bacterium]|jgi:hypothetical protein